MSYKITKPVRLIELFSGVGAQAMALRDLNVDFMHWKTSEWEVNAIKSYKAIHMPDDDTDYSAELNKEELVDALYKINISTNGKDPLEKKQIARKGEKWLINIYNCIKSSKNIGSVVNIHAADLEIIDKDKYEYILTYSFPCTDLSLAGQRKGMDKGSGTSSSLLWEVQRILEECNEKDCLPQILLMENVPQVHGKKNINNWNIWLSTLRELGYTSWWKDLNAKDYGIAQNRNRCFCISILGEYPYNAYTFPEPIELKTRIEDYLEPIVDEKFYIKTEKAKELICNLIDRGILAEREREGVSKRESTSQQTNLKSDQYLHVSKQDKEELQISDKMNLGFLKTISMKNMSSNVLIPSGSEIDISHTLCARDWKGVNNYGFNGVVESNE